MLTVKGVFSFKLKINDILVDDFIFRKCLVKESTQLLLPLLELEIQLLPKTLDSIVIVDGAKIQVSITSLNTNDNSSDYFIPFRVFSHRIALGNDNLYRVLITGYYDSPLLMQSKCKTYKGTSYVVMSQIASYVGLTFDGDASNDSQSWLCHNIRLGLFLKQVEKHAYNGDYSCFVSAIRRDNSLVFYDLYSRSQKSDINWIFTINTSNINDDKILYVDSFSLSSSSGIMNATQGYGRTYAYLDTTSSQSDTSLNQFEINSFHKNTQVLQASKDLFKKQGFTKYPMKTDNTHSNYQRAAAQNTRIKSLNSVKLTCRSPFLKNVKLLDRVNVLYPSSSQGTTLDTYSGVYYISSIDTLLANTEAMRKITLVREGLNPQNSAGNTLIGSN